MVGCLAIPVTSTHKISTVPLPFKSCHYPMCPEEGGSGETNLPTVENHCPRSMNIIPEKQKVTEVSRILVLIIINYSYHLLSASSMLRHIILTQGV